MIKSGDVTLNASWEEVVESVVAGKVDTDLYKYDELKKSSMLFVASDECPTCLQGHNGTYSQLDGSGLMNLSGVTYPDTSLLYYMRGYYPYSTGTYMGVDGHPPYYSSSNAMPCYE